MDPSSPEFRPRLPSTDSQALANDAKWRTTCRTCGGSFKSRNQLMRHLYKTHPGKPAKLKATSRETPKKATRPQPVQTLLSPLPTAHKQERSQVHPFILLSAQQKLVFVARVLFVIFAVYMHQLQEERGQQNGQEPRREREDDYHQDQQQHLDGEQTFSPQFATPPSKDKTSPTPKSGPSPITPPGADDATTPGHIHQGRAKDDSDLEDSDNDDGGVSLSGPGLGEAPFWISSEEGQWDELDGYISLD